MEPLPMTALDVRAAEGAASDHAAPEGQTSQTSQPQSTEAAPRHVIASSVGQQITPLITKQHPDRGRLLALLGWLAWGVALPLIVLQVYLGLFSSAPHPALDMFAALLLFAIWAIS